MEKLNKDQLLSLEQYAADRKSFRARVVEHKKNRRLAIGPNLTLYFEDRLTVQYQVQEMLRIERIFEAEGIEEELQTYNPLIPDGHNLKATMMIEFGDEAERRIALAKMINIEQKIWLKIDELDRVYPIANEDLERTTDEKTSSVHFLRFELSADMIRQLKGGEPLLAGVEHEAYRHEVMPVPLNISQALAADLS